MPYLLMFVRYGVWMRVYSQTPSVEQCVKHFVTMAEKESWRVQAEAEQLLAEKLKERSESETENIIVVGSFSGRFILNSACKMVGTKSSEPGISV